MVTHYGLDICHGRALIMDVYYILLHRTCIALGFCKKMSQERVKRKYNAKSNVVVQDASSAFHQAPSSAFCTFREMEPQAPTTITSFVSVGVRQWAFRECWFSFSFKEKKKLKYLEGKFHHKNTSFVNVQARYVHAPIFLAPFRVSPSIDNTVHILFL